MFIDFNADLYFMATRPIVTTAAFEINILICDVHVAGLNRQLLLLFAGRLALSGREITRAIRQIACLVPKPAFIH